MTEHERGRLDLDAYAARAQAGPCFICELVAGRNPHPVVYRDDFAIAFLNRYPTLLGYVLVAPLEHKEDVVADFDEAAYLRLQSLIYRVGRAVSSVLPTERLYVVSLGSKQGNTHVHWHVAPLPPGVPYEKQQFRALMHEEDGYLVVPPEEAQHLAARIASSLCEEAGRRQENGAT
ncbi:MAG TPA: HIT family protein [Acidimicrobiales bacterium]|nr:HIT family protein [Acidimicrobiales bacterium]